MPADTPEPSLTDRPPLRRDIGRGLLLFMIVGDILGAGIYVLIGDVAAGVGGFVWLAFGLAFGIAACSAFSYAQLVTRFPRASGSAHYASQAFKSPAVSRFVAFAIFVSGVATAATTARAFAGQYLAEFVRGPEAVIAVVLVVALSLLARRGIRISAGANVVMTLIEFSGLILLIGLGVAAVAVGDAELDRVTQRPPGGLQIGAVASATALAFFAFLGFEDTVHLAEEVREPRRTFPPVLIGGVIITAVVYVFVAITAVAVVDPNTLAESPAALLEVVRQSPGGVPLRLFSAIALVAVTNTCLFSLVAATRLVYGMAQDQQLPKLLARVHSRYRTPTAAGIVAAVAAAGLAVTGGASELADTAVTALLGVLVVVNLAAARTRSTDIDRAFTSKRWIAPVGAAGSAVLCAHQLVTADFGELARLGILIGAGAIVTSAMGWSSRDKG